MNRLFKGTSRKDRDGLLFTAFPKVAVSRAEMQKKMAQVGREMGASTSPEFSQIPLLATKNAGTKVIALEAKVASKT